MSTIGRPFPWAANFLLAVQRYDSADEAKRWVNVLLDPEHTNAAASLVLWDLNAVPTREAYQKWRRENAEYLNEFWQGLAPAAAPERSRVARQRDLVASPDRDGRVSPATFGLDRH